VKYLTLFLLASFIMVHTELHELFNIPALITHYFCHKQENPTQNIFDFLSEHYNTENHSHNDSNTQHKKLPFKHDKIISNLSLSISQTFYLVFQYPFMRNIKVFILCNTVLPDLMLCKGIWQPPRM